MRVLAVWVVALTLTLGHAIPFRKGGYGQTIIEAPIEQQKGQQVYPVQQTGDVALPEGEQETPEDEDDPDWTPTDEDYEYYDYSDEDYDEDSDEDDVKDDPDWTPSEEDYDDDDDYSEENYGYYDIHYDEDDPDNIWLSDDDPDFVPDEDLSDEDELWLSDEDPDWVPDEDDIYSGEQDPISVEQTSVEQTSVEETSDEQDLYSVEDQSGELDQTLIQELAQAMLTKAGTGTLDDMIALILSLDLSREEAEEALLGFQLEEDLVEQGQEQELDPNQVDQSYQQSYVKRPLRQYKGQFASYEQQQSGQVQQGQQYNNHQDLAEGVEPLSPGIPGRVDVATGVEPVSAEEPSFISWIGNTWRDASETLDEFGDRAGDKFDDIRDSISGAVGTAVDKVQDVAETAGEHIVNTYHVAKDKLIRLKERLAVIFTKFGVTIQLGAEYCFRKLTSAVDQARSGQVMDKLEQALQNGNEQVSELFALLGQKISTWRQQHSGTDVDTGLIISGGQEEDSGLSDLQWESQDMPDFFQDQEVQGKLDKIVEQGTLPQEDLDFILQQTQQSSYRVRRERKMRSWVDSMKAFAR